MQTIKIECSSCGGTGLYAGFAEPQGEAVVCLRCSGTGWEEFSYKPFTTRKPRSDIKYVRRSRGTTILGCGPTGSCITYAEFQNGKLPN